MSDPTEDLGIRLARVEEKLDSIKAVIEHGDSGVTAQVLLVAERLERLGEELRLEREERIAQGARLGAVDDRQRGIEGRVRDLERTVDGLLTRVVSIEAQQAVIAEIRAEIRGMGRLMKAIGALAGGGGFAVVADLLGWIGG